MKAGVKYMCLQGLLFVVEDKKKKDDKKGGIYHLTSVNVLIYSFVSDGLPNQNVLRVGV